MALAWQETAFSLALSAMAVPVVVLVEMRLITPLILLLRTRKAHKLALCAALYMLVVGLRRQVRKILIALALADSADGGGEGGGGAGGGERDGEGRDGEHRHGHGHEPPEDSAGGGGQPASESAAAAADGDSGGGYSLDGGGGADEDGAGDAGFTHAAVDASQIAEDAAMKASMLLARAAAAKEVDVKKLEAQGQRVALGADEPTSRPTACIAATSTALTSTARLRKTSKPQDDVDVDADADADDGDADDADDGGD